MTDMLGLLASLHALVLSLAQVNSQAGKDEALRRLEGNPPDLTVIGQLGADPRVAPTLARTLSRQVNREIKLRVAAELVKVGDPTGEARAYLRKGAIDAVNSSGPDPFAVDVNGTASSTFTREFVAWSRSQGRTPEEQLRHDMDATLEIEMLAMAKDQSARAIFRGGLRSGFLVAKRCAIGLAMLGSVEDIGLIVGQMLNASPNPARVDGFAFALGFYADASARREIERLLDAHPQELSAYRKAFAARESGAARRALPK